MSSNEKVTDAVIEAENKLQELVSNSHSVVDIRTVKEWLNRIKKANR